MSIYIDKNTEIGKVYFGTEQIGKIYDHEKNLIYSAEVLFKNLSCECPSAGPADTNWHWLYSHSSSGYWDLSEITTLTITVKNDLRIGYWFSGDHTKVSGRRIILTFNDKSTETLSMGAETDTITFDLSHKTKEQRSKVTLQGGAYVWCNSVSYSAYYGGVVTSKVIGS